MASNDYQSTIKIHSKLHPGVSYQVVRMSFDRRMLLMRQVREIARELEFYRAGQTDAEQMEAHILNAQIERAYISWGVSAIEGLRIDGVEATPESLLERGPEDLVHEAIQAVRAECSLTEEERKN